MPRFMSAGSESPTVCRVSAQPLMAVSGVFISWETVEMKSFFILSVELSSSAMKLMFSDSSEISSWYSCGSIRADMSPPAMRFVTSLICRIGWTMESMNVIPETIMMSPMARSTMSSANRMRTICRFVWCIDTT